MPQQAVQDALKSIHEYAIKCLAQTEELRELAPHLGNPVQSLRPRALLDGVVAAVKVRLPPSFHFHIENKAPEMTYLLGREKVLAWCFTQIIENSHNHGGSEVRVTIRPLQTESMPKSMSGDLLEVDRFLEFAFEDDGPGVDSRYLNEVFEWKKAHLKTRGRGEAMALCKVYVGHMDGMIWCSLSDETGLRAGALKMHLALPLELR